MASAATRAVLIIRVSDPRQEKEGLSLDNQEETLRRYAAEEHFEIVRVFRFQESADLKIRRRFHEMINFVRSRSTVTAIIGYRVDRLTRNFHDHVLLDELRLKHGKELHFVYDRIVVTQRTVGREIQDWDTKVYLAKMYLNRLKEDAVVSSAYKVSRGEWPGKAPYGYSNVKRDGRSWIEPNPITAPVVTRCFDLYASGIYSMEQVRLRVCTEFCVTLSKGKLDHILKNPFYHGEMAFKGKRYPHVYKPLIERSKFERTEAQKASFKKSSFKYAGLDFTYRGLIVCAHCGCRITPERKKKGDRSYSYYHCTNYHRKHQPAWLREEVITAEFQHMFKGLYIPADRLDATIATLRQSHEAKITYASSVRSHLLAEREKYAKRVEVLYEDRLDGLISKEAYLDRKASYEQSAAAVDRRLKDLADADDCYYESSIRLLELCASAADLWAAAAMDERRALLKTVLQNCRLDNKKLLWELKSPFSAVVGYVDRQMWLPMATAFRHKRVSIDFNSEEIEALFAQLHPVIADLAA